MRMRLFCDDFWVDVRLTEFDGRWLASADTPKGPTLGWATSPLAATIDALAPFAGRIEALMATAPPELFPTDY